MFQVPYTARQQYLAAQAEARAAQARAESARAEYLAQEAILQEEAALKARLYEIEQRKRYASPTPFASSQYAPSQYGWPQESLTTPYSSFSPPGLPFPTRQALAPFDLLELEYQKQAQVQALERRRKEAEQDRLRKHYEAQLAAKLEQELQKQAIKAAEVSAARARGSYGCNQLSPAPRLASRHPCLHPVLQAAAAQPSKAPKPQSSQRAMPTVVVDEDELKHLFAGLFGVPHTTPTAKPQPSPASVRSGDVAQPKAKAVPTPKPQASGESLVDQLKARYKIDNDEEIKDTILAVIDSLSEVVPAVVEQAPKVAPKKPSVEASLVEQLQARSQSEEDQELRDTIQATLNSLLPEFNTPPTPKASTSASHSRSSSKAKAEVSPPATPSVESRLEEVHRIEEEFHKFESEFVFPSQLDFITSANPSSTALAHLAFTARNHPVRFYEQALGSLLTELDSIESQGDATLRSKRKETVRLVEQALETLEEQIMGRWNATKTKEEAPASFTVLISGGSASEGEKVDLQDDVAPSPACEESTSTEPDVETVLEPVPEEFETLNVTSQVKPEGDMTSSSISELETQSAAESSPDFTLEEVEELESTSPSESQLTIKPEDTITPTSTLEEQSTPDTVGSVADSEESETNDGFLLAQTEEERPKHKSKKSQVEDLGSDWSDLDA